MDDQNRRDQEGGYLKETIIQSERALCRKVNDVSATQDSILTAANTSTHRYDAECDRRAKCEGAL